MKPIYNYKNPETFLGFGKYRDWKIGDLIKKKPLYIKWCFSTMKEFHLWEELDKEYKKALKALDDKRYNLVYGEQILATNKSYKECIMAREMKIRENPRNWALNRFEFVKQ